MAYSLFSSAAVEINTIPAGKLPFFISSYKKEFQTGLMEVDFHNHSGHHLLFTRGELVNVYRHAEKVERINPDDWFRSIDTSKGKAYLRAFALTPQAVRLVKILLEQADVPLTPLPENIGLEEQFQTWSTHPAPALAYVRWPGAEALALLPGDGNPPHYTLFVSANQILHSAGGMMALYGWKESCNAISFLGSEAHTPAWDEYLLHYSFSWMTGYLLERLINLTGPALVNTILRDVNFTAAAHGWKISITGVSVTDQMIFSSPAEAADVYSRLFEILFRHTEVMIGSDLLAILMRESAIHLSGPCRSVLQEYLLITPV